MRLLRLIFQSFRKTRRKPLAAFFSLGPDTVQHEIYPYRSVFLNNFSYLLSLHLKESLCSLFRTKQKFGYVFIDHEHYVFAG